MITNCRSCRCPDLQVILDLGAQPIANALLSEEELERPEARFPLAVAFCPACALLQVTETVPADLLYRRDYPDFSSSSPALLKHSSEHVEALVCKYRLGPYGGSPASVLIRPTDLQREQTRLACQPFTISSDCSARGKTGQGEVSLRTS